MSTLCSVCFIKNLGYEKEKRAGHLLPLYIYDNSTRTFLTPLFGHWRAADIHYNYVATPLLGTYGGQARGFWLFPLVSHFSEPSGKTSRLLWAKYRRSPDGAGKFSLFPIYKRTIYGDPTDYREARITRDASKLVTTNDYGEFKTLGHRSTWLLGLGSRKSIYDGRREKANDENEKPYELVTLWHTISTRQFLLWKGYSSDIQYIYSVEEPNDKVLRRVWARSEFEFLSFVYRSESSKDIYDNPVGKAVNQDKASTSVLGYLYRHQRINGNSSTDIFPAITIDRRADGARKFSILWRLYRNERDAEGNRKLDILFLPIRR